MIGAIIMVHGDDQGLILPPKLAPIQAVIVPIWKNDAERAATLEAAARVRAALIAAGIRTKTDEREGSSPGFKFNDWEMRGLPLRIEIGPKDVANNSLVLARRDKPGREGKSPAPQSGVAEAVSAALAAVQKSLYDRALAFREAHTREPRNFEEFKEAVETGFARAFWCGQSACEEKIKEATKATMRCIPLEQSGGGGACILCGSAAREQAIFAKAY
jgi:prolyl-tRNA synthetase